MINLLYKIFGIRSILLKIQRIFFYMFYHKHFTASTKIFGMPIISICKKSKVKIGENLVLISSSFFSEPGVNHPVIIRTLSSNAKLTIGDNVGISGGGICCADSITVGNNVMFGANAFATDTDFHPINPFNRRFSKDNTQKSPVIIEDNVFLGMNVLILKGVKIGKNSVIGAGSIVVSNIPSNVIAAGNPCKIIKKIK